MQHFIEAKVVADSLNPQGERALTLQLKYPRSGTHEQVLMHRAFSRSCGSGRAMPVTTMMSKTMTESYVPFEFRANQSGMQPGEELPDDAQEDARRIWEEHRNYSVLCAHKLSKLGVHKQWANRLMETHTYIPVVLTTSKKWLDHFLDLRVHNDAQSEIFVLASLIRDVVEVSEPQVLKPMEWHLPYVSPEELYTYEEHICLNLSAARCARTSYFKHDQTNPDPEEDRKLALKLITSQHMNPFEHQLRAQVSSTGNVGQGWHSWRHILEKI